MKLQTLVILGFISFCLGFYIYYSVEQEFDGKTSHQERILPGDWSRLEWLELENVHGLLRIEKDDHGRWFVQEPYNDLANESEFTDLLKTFKELARSKTILDEEEFQKRSEPLEQYGLDDPELRLHYKTSDIAEPVSWLFGNTNPAGTGVYLKEQGSKKVFLSKQTLTELRKKEPEELREMKLLTVESENFTEVSIEKEGERIRFEKDNEQMWRMTDPYELPIDQEYTRSQINKIWLIRANRFIENAPATLRTPDIRIVVGFNEGVRDLRTHEGDARPHGAEIALAKKRRSNIENPSSDDYDYFASSDKTGPARIARFHFDNFSGSYRDFVKTTFDDFLSSEVESLEVHHNDTSRYFERDEKDFETQLLHLRNLKAERFIGLAQRNDIPRESLQIKLATKGGKERTYTFHSKEEMLTMWFQSGQGPLMTYEMKPDAFDQTLYLPEKEPQHGE